MMEMVKFIALGVVLVWLIRHVEKHGADRLALIFCFVEIGLFFNCVGLI